MKSLQTHLKNDMNESFMAFTISLWAAYMIFCAVCIKRNVPEGNTLFGVIRDNINALLKEKRLNKIAERLKDDPDVIEFVNNPKLKGWKKMLETKLDEDEMKYINSLTRNHFN